MIIFLLVGLGSTIGVLLNPLIEYYDSDPSTISWAGSLFVGMRFMFGPLVGGLTNKYGLRPICITGSIVMTIGFLTSPFSPNVPILMLTFGAIAGFGASLVYLPANIAIGYYFESKRSLAAGITRVGGSLGQFVYAPLGTFLINNHGLKVTIFVIAGFAFLCVLLGILMHPLGASEENNKKLMHKGPLYMSIWKSKPKESTKVNSPLGGTIFSGCKKYDNPTK